MTGSVYTPSARCTLLVPTPTAKRQNLHHLMLVITDPVDIPPPSVVVVPLNTYFDGCDEACVLDVGDHPFIRTKSFVNFQESRIREVSKIQAGVEREIFFARDDISQAVHDSVCSGFETSRAMDTLVRGIYRRYKRQSQGAA